MPQFRKKPVVIEAFKLTRESRADMTLWPGWMQNAWATPHEEPGAMYPADHPDSDGTDELLIYTLEGLHRVSFDDYVIQGVKGELYPCKPDIFEATYDKV